MRSRRRHTSEAVLSVSVKHADNFIIPMTKEQIDSVRSAKSKTRSYITLTFSLEQMKAGRKLDKSVVTAILPHKSDGRSIPSLQSELEAMSIVELARLYEIIVEVIAKKVAHSHKQAENIKSSVKRGPLIDTIDYPCDISYNEDLYCQKCRKRTENKISSMTEEGGKNYVHCMCSVCNSKKSRVVNTNKEIEDGRISFI